MPKKLHTWFWAYLFWAALYNFCTVSLIDSRRISENKDTDELTLSQSHLQQYSSCNTSLAQVNFFFANYTANGKLQPQSVIVSTFPSYSSKVKITVSIAVYNSIHGATLRPTPGKLAVQQIKKKNVDAY